MSPISEEYTLLVQLKPKLVKIRDFANQIITANSSRPSLFALRNFIILLNKDLTEFTNMFTRILQSLSGNTNLRITETLTTANVYIFNILSQGDKFRWVSKHAITNSDVDTIITSLKNICAITDTYALTSLTNLMQSIEERDNPRAYYPARSSSRSSSSRSSSSRSSRSSSSTRSSSRHHTSPSSPRHHTPPQRQSVTPLNLEALSMPSNRLPPPPLQRQNAQNFTPIPMSRLSSTSSLDLTNASGKKYLKTKVKRRRTKATHRRPLSTNNSRKHRKTKTKK